MAGAACLMCGPETGELESAMIRPLLLSHKQPPVLAASETRRTITNSNNQPLRTDVQEIKSYRG